MRPETPSTGILLTAYAVSQLGNWLFRTGVVFFAYNQNGGSAAVLTTAIILVYLPILFGSRLLAPLADRLDTRVALIGLDALRALVMLGLLLAVWAGTGTTTTVTIGVLAFLSLLTPFFTASQTAYLRRTLPGDLLPPALAAVTRVEWLMFVLGTAAGPLLLQHTDLATLVVLDIATFVVSGLLLLRLSPAPAPADTGVDTGGRRRVQRISPSSRLLLLSVVALNLGAGLINVYPNVVAREFLDGGAAWLSAINLANGVGGVVGAVLAGRLAKRGHLRPGVVAAAVVSVSLAGMVFASTAWLALLSSSLMLGAGQVFAVIYQSRVLANEPVGVAGRVSGHFTLATFAGVTGSTLLFLGVTNLGELRYSFTVLLLLGAASAAVGTAIGAAARHRFGATAQEVGVATPTRSV
jgi:hypothetical protein